jgi:hypothetical protein
MLNTEDTGGRSTESTERSGNGVNWPQGQVDGEEGRCCMSRFAGDEH